MLDLVRMLFDVGFFAADQFVLDFDVFLHIEHDDLGPIAGAIFGYVRQVEHAEVAHALLERADSGVYETLAFFRELILRIFGEVTVGAGDRDFLW